MFWPNGHDYELRVIMIWQLVIDWTYLVVM